MNRNLTFVVVSLLFWGIGEGMFLNFVPIYLGKEFALGEEQIGLALGMFGFFSAITHMPSGYLADRIGRRPLLITAWILGLASTFTMGISTALPFYLVGLFGYGLTAFVSSPLSSYVTAARGEMPVGTALSLVSASFNIGMALGPVTGGWIGDHYGMRMSYLVAAVIFLFSVARIFFIKNQPLDKHDPEAPPVTLWKNRGFISFLGMVGFAVFAMYLAQPLTPNFLEGVRKFSLSDTGWIFSAGALGNALFAIGFSRLDPRRGFLFAQVLVVLFALIMWKGFGLPLFMLGYFLLGGFRAARPMAQAQGRELVHQSQMGLMYGTLETVNATIFIFTPPLAGYLFVIDPFLIYPLAMGLITLAMISTFIFSYRKVQHA